MRISCISRHDGAINVQFMDWNARPVGFKELWTPKWHRHLATNDPWTGAGLALPDDWTQWMRGFRDY